MPEIITSGVNGYLLNNENEKELTMLLVKVFEDDEMKNRVEKMSKNYEDYYSWDRIAGDMIEVIKNEQIKKGV